MSGESDLEQVARESPDAVRAVAERAADNGADELSEWLLSKVVTDDE